MDFVCQDDDGLTNWSYNPDDTCYYRVDNSGNTISHLKGEYLPDPNQVWQARCNLANVSQSSLDGQKLRPTNTLFSLWTHRLGL